MELLTSFLGRNGFLPHGYCFTWSPGLLCAAGFDGHISKPIDVANFAATVRGYLGGGQA